MAVSTILLQSTLGYSVYRYIPTEKDIIEEKWETGENDTTTRKEDTRKTREKERGRGRSSEKDGKQTKAEGEREEGEGVKQRTQDKGSTNR